MKNLKIVAIIIVFFLANSSVNAQMAVADASANLQLSAINKGNASTLAKAAAQLEQLKSMKEQYDKQIDMVESISAYVKKSKQVINMKNCLTDITSEYSEGINYVYNEKEISPKDRAVFAKVYAQMIADALDDFEYGYKVIGDGTLKMNDAERLNILTQVETKMNKNRNMILYMNRTVKSAVGKRKRDKAESDYIKNNKNSFNAIK